MNMDKLMARSLHYFLLRDALLLFLIFTHTIITYELIAKLQSAILFVVGFLSVVWLGYYMRSVWMYLKAKKDPYLKEAINDEYIKEIVFKSSYHGYASMVVTSSILIAISLLLSHLPTRIVIPYYIACEIILFSGIVTSDISKMIQVRA